MIFLSLFKSFLLNSMIFLNIKKHNNNSRSSKSTILIIQRLTNFILTYLSFKK